MTGPPRLRGELGSGSIWVLIAALMVMALGLMVVLTLGLAAARARAATAADLAALAAAGSPQAASPCALAAHVAAAHDAALQRCLVRRTPLGSIVDVEVTTSWSVAIPGGLTVRSRAGPVEAREAAG